MIKNIIFDIGQVLAEFRWRDYIDELTIKEEYKERLAKATVLSPYWNEVDRGALSKEEIMNRCISIDPEIEKEIKLFFEDTSQLVEEFEYSEELVKNLKSQGYRIYILSNYGRENFSYVKDVFRFLKHVDGAVISYEEQHIKPEPQIYEALISRYGIVPEESVFLDDLAANLEGAEAFNFQTIQFHSLWQAKKELRSLGVMVEEREFDSIIFDLDGTMWDSTENAAIVWKEIAEKDSRITDEVTGPKLKALYGLPLEDIARGLFLSVPEEVAIETMEECVVAQCPYLAKHGGILLGKIEETLKELSKKYRLFIVSNCKSGYIEAFLEAHKLGQYFDDFECPGGTGKLKADNIRIVMKRNQLRNPIYVGDTGGDGDAAHQAKIPFVYARYGFGSATEYEYVVDSFEQLTTLRMTE